MTLRLRADKAEQTLRLHDRKFSAFSRTALSLENVSGLSSGRRPKGEHPAGAAVQVLVSPQVESTAPRTRCWLIIR